MGIRFGHANLGVKTPLARLTGELQGGDTGALDPGLAVEERRIHREQRTKLGNRWLFHIKRADRRPIAHEGFGRGGVGIQLVQTLCA